MATGKDREEKSRHESRNESVLDPRETASVLQAIYLFAAGCGFAILGVGLAGGGTRVTLLGGSGGALFVLLLALVRVRQIHAAGVLGTLCLLGIVLLSVVTGHGVRDLSFPVFGFIMLLANLVLKERWARVATVGTWMISVGVGAAEYLGLFVTDMSFATTGRSVVIIASVQLVLALTARRLVRAFRGGLERAHVQELSYRHIFNATTEGIFLIDPNTECIVDVNKSAQTLFGYSRDEFLRSSLQQLAGKSQSVEQVVSMMDSTMRGEPLLFDWSVDCKDGSELPVEVSLRPANVGAKDVLLAVVRDATESRRMQAKLQESEKLQAVGQLAGGIAHDFNNQLTGILANASLLQDRIDNPRLKKCAELIVRCSRRSSDLTSQLLAFARRGKHQNINVDIQELIGEVVELLKHTIDKRIRLETALLGGDVKVQGDPTLLQNALLNLGLNACDAMKKGGVLTFSTDIHHVENTHMGVSTTVKHGEYVQIQVRDTGEGMEEAVQKRVFEPFFTTKETGNGMGLAAVYGAVESHKGDISVASQVGEGTTFTILLPISQLQRESVTLRVSSPIRSFPGKRVLLAEDEEDVAEAATTLLEELGCAVSRAADGQAAVELFEERPEDFDVLVLDHMMPRLSGREALKKIREIKPHIPALIVSGFSTETVIESESGDSFLQKPFNEAQLAQSLARVLETSGTMKQGAE